MFRFFFPMFGLGALALVGCGGGTTQTTLGGVDGSAQVGLNGVRGLHRYGRAGHRLLERRHECRGRTDLLVEHFRRAERG